MSLWRGSADVRDHVPPLQPQQTSQSHHCLLQFVVSEMQNGLLRNASSWHLPVTYFAWLSPGLWGAATQRDGVGPQALRVCRVEQGAVRAWQEGLELGMGKEGTTGLMKGGKRLVKGKVRNEKGESDRPFKWNGMGSHSISLVLPANFLFFQCKQNTWCIYAEFFLQNVFSLRCL